MNGVVVLIGAFVLLLDLADDGHLGQDRFIAPHSPLQSLDAAADHYGFGQADFQNELPRTNFLGIPDQFPSLPATSVVQPRRKIIGFCHLSSAGGLPLLLPLVATPFLGDFKMPSYGLGAAGLQFNKAYAGLT